MRPNWIFGGHYMHRSPDFALSLANCHPLISTWPYQRKHRKHSQLTYTYQVYVTPHNRIIEILLHCSLWESSALIDQVSIPYRIILLVHVVYTYLCTFDVDSDGEQRYNLSEPFFIHFLLLIRHHHYHPTYHQDSKICRPPWGYN